ncbi:MAG TPA: alpha/beta fold hydrolase [Candidatus Baltobacteraceae bacterium]|nr:alpha/beta fold hydrolase [Candidatus Baltobacteraceae bacterium]
MTDAAYEDAQLRLERFLERDRNAQVGEAGRTLTFDHGRRTERAILLFHGLSASPRQFLAIAESLHARGHNVFVPRLPRHGYANRLSEALALMNAQQLQACAADALAVARGLGRSVTVAGFSLGGLLTAYVGQREPVDRVVAISPFLGISVIPDLLHVPLARWLLRRPNRFYWWDPLLRDRQMPEHGYPRFASHAIGHSLTLAHEMMELARTQTPHAAKLVLVVNPRDSTVNRRAIAQLAKRWSAHKPGAVRITRLHGLPPFVHDIIEPKRHPRVAQRVLPVLVELIEG